LKSLSSNTYFHDIRNQSIILKKKFKNLLFNDEFIKFSNFLYFVKSVSFSLLKEDNIYLSFLKKYQNWQRNKMNLNLNSLIRKKIYPTFFQQGEQIHVTKLNLLSQLFRDSINLNLKIEPIYSGASHLALEKASFLDEAAHKANNKCLAESSLYGKVDWAFALRANNLFAGKSSSGSTFFSKKADFNNIYYFKQ